MVKPVLSRLKLKRLELRLTQQKVAEAIGVSRSYINSLENGRDNLTDSLLLKLAKHYQCVPADLI